MKRLFFEDYIKLISKDSLHKEYIINNKTGKECSVIFNLPTSTLSRLLKYYNIEKPKDLHTKSIKKAKLEKYGDANYNNQNKRAKTNITKYGVDNQFKREDLMQRIREDNKLKYGSKNNILKNLETREKNSGSIEISYKEQIIKTRKTVLEKYGVDRASKSELVKDLIKQSVKETFQERYGCDNYWDSEDAKRSNGSKNSHANIAFEQLLKENNIKYEKEFLLENKWYDFKINNILVEINPTATHNSTRSPWCKDKGLDKNYHSNKTELANKNNYRCIHIWDWDDPQKVINTLLLKKETIWARKCKVKLVSTEEEINFLNRYHFQGYIKSKIAIGLYYKNELVMLMTFGKPRYSKKYSTELLRLCSSKSVIGGAQKLFKYYISQYNPQNVVSYCDLSKFEGEVYSNLGFKKISKSISRHWYNIKLQDHITDKLLFRYGFDKLLGRTFGTFGKDTSNERLMLEHGFVEIYDCGQATYVWKNEKSD
jgi:hypothetical protein